jgi:hypothetical protein
VRYQKVLLSLFFLGCAASLQAQSPLGFGIKGGYSLTSELGTFSSLGVASSGQYYVVGPFAELRLPFGIGVEGDALYERVTSSQGGYWEFPVLANYHFSIPAPIVKPYVEAGPSFRAHTSNLPALTSRGFLAGAGVEFKLPVIRLSSDLRYTRWSQPGPASSFPNVNQVELVFGIGF